MNARRVLAAWLCWTAIPLGLSAQSASEEFAAQGTAGAAIGSTGTTVEQVTGIIRRNHGRSAEQAPFVLMDEAGQVIRYDLMPSSQVNLAALEGQKVVLSGARETVAGRWLQRVRVAQAAPLTAGVTDSQVQLAAATTGSPTPAQGAVSNVATQMSSLPPGATAVAQAMPTQGVIVDPPVMADSAMMAEGPIFDGGAMGYGAGGSYGAGFQQGLGYPAGPGYPGGYAYRSPFANLVGYYNAPQADDGVGPAHWYWVRAEYLLWFTKGLNAPALVTTGTTASEGVIGRAGTTVLFPTDSLLRDVRNGGRIRFGTWLDPAQNLGIEGELLGLSELSEEFFRSGDGTASQILARPFFNGLTDQEDSQLISDPGDSRGDIRVRAEGDFYSGGARALMKICTCVGCSPCDSCSACDSCGGAPAPMGGCGFLGISGATAVRLTGGYRFTRLNESIVINENLTSLQTNNPGSFAITDSFITRNEFHGGELGVMFEARRYRWWLDLTGRIGFGNNRQTATINGSTITTVNNNSTTSQGGILAQRTNIGTHTREDFTMIPEMGVNLGYQLTPRLSGVVGYTMIYFPNVVRPGDMIDRTINPNLFPAEAVPFTGPLRPEFVWRTSDYWAQGLNFGVDYRW